MSNVFYDFTDLRDLKDKLLEPPVDSPLLNERRRKIVQRSLQFIQATDTRGQASSTKIGSLGEVIRAIEALAFAEEARIRHRVAVVELALRFIESSDTRGQSAATKVGKVGHLKAVVDAIEAELPECQEGA